jgi:hypothetical protein
MKVRTVYLGSVMAMIFSLSQAANAAAADEARSAENGKVVCREVIPVGTMVNKQLVCMSRAAWNKARDSRRDADDYSGEYLQLKDPASPEMMQLGRADWAQMPQLAAKGKVPYPQLVKQTRELLRTKACSIPGQSAKKFDIDVNYGVKFDGSGKVSRVLVEESGCSLINALVGLAVLARADRGDFNIPGNAAGRWHADKMNLTLL